MDVGQPALAGLGKCFNACPVGGAVVFAKCREGC